MYMRSDVSSTASSAYISTLEINPGIYKSRSFASKGGQMLKASSSRRYHSNALAQNYTHNGSIGVRSITKMGNPHTTGPFAPIVKVTREVMGVKKFNKIRGKAISLHSQVIKEFCRNVGAGSKQAQGVIRLAKKNGEKLGFLA